MEDLFNQICARAGVSINPKDWSFDDGVSFGLAESATELPEGWSEFCEEKIGA